MVTQVMSKGPLPLADAVTWVVSKGHRDAMSRGHREHCYWGNERANSPLHHGGGVALHSEAQGHGHALPDSVGTQADQDLRGPAQPLFIARAGPSPGRPVLCLRGAMIQDGLEQQHGGEGTLTQAPFSAPHSVP